jgi:hypothetical protein
MPSLVQLAKLSEITRKNQANFPAGSSQLTAGSRDKVLTTEQVRTKFALFCKIYHLLPTENPEAPLVKGGV